MTGRAHRGAWRDVRQGRLRKGRGVRPPRQPRGPAYARKRKMCIPRAAAMSANFGWQQDAWIALERRGSGRFPCSRVQVGKEVPPPLREGIVVLASVLSVRKEGGQLARPSTLAPASGTHESPLGRLHAAGPPAGLPLRPPKAGACGTCPARELSPLRAGLPPGLSLPRLPPGATFVPGLRKGADRAPCRKKTQAAVSRLCLKGISVGGERSTGPAERGPLSIPGRETSFPVHTVILRGRSAARRYPSPLT